MTTASIRAMKLLDESRGYPGAASAADSELFLDLEADTTYWIELCFSAWTADIYGACLHNRLIYSGTLDDTKTHLVTNAMPSGFTSVYRNRGSSEVNLLLSQAGMQTETYLFNDSGSSNSGLRSQKWVCGRLTTNTAGRLGLWWRHASTAPVTPSTVFHGSFLLATPLDICAVAYAPEVFALTAGKITFGGLDYYGTDPDGYVTGTPFGTVVPDPLVSGYRVLEFESNVTTLGGPPQTNFGFALQNPGGDPPPANAFTSISWTGPGGVITLTRATANLPGGDSTSADARFWSWPNDLNYFADGVTYNVTITY
jgi:hypothetical protein